MRHQIVKHLMTHEIEMREEIERLVEQAIDAFDFEAIVIDTVTRTLQQSLQAIIRKDVEQAADGAWKEMRDFVMGKLLKRELLGDDD
jgi:hypothetical protein